MHIIVNDVAPFLLGLRVCGPRREAQHAMSRSVGELLLVEIVEVDEGRVGDGHGAGSDGRRGGHGRHQSRAVGVDGVGVLEDVDLELGARSEPLGAHVICRLHRCLGASDTKQESLAEIRLAERSRNLERNFSRHLSVRCFDEDMLDIETSTIAVEVEGNKGRRVVIVAPARIERTVLDDMNVGDVNTFDHGLRPIGIATGLTSVDSKLYFVILTTHIVEIAPSKDAPFWQMSFMFMSVAVVTKRTSEVARLWCVL